MKDVVVVDARGRVHQRKKKRERGGREKGLERDA